MSATTTATAVETTPAVLRLRAGDEETRRADEETRQFLVDLCSGLSVTPLPPSRARDETLAHAPVRTTHLSPEEEKTALRNALRYFPESCHAELAAEFAAELRRYGHIYMYRFMPDTSRIRAYPLRLYPGQSRQATSIILMIMNNLDHRVAQFPQELVTYGGNGQVFSNWAQFRLTLHYLSTMTDRQTLALYSGHPLGLFPSTPAAPRAVVTNGLVIPNHSSRRDYDRMFALGVTQYGQMTAGSYCYIGPQGIVHGTTLTVLNAGRLYLGSAELVGRVFLTSGLGGMSGAQAKAATVSGCVGVIAEVSREAIYKRHAQGWLDEVIDDLDSLVERVRRARQERRPVSIGFHGNAVSVWERMVEEHRRSGELLVDLGSDQTSCHAPFSGGYYPVQLGYDEARRVLAAEPDRFRQLVQESLVRQIAAIDYLTERGMAFWDYGNAFLLEAGRAGANVHRADDPTGLRFRYPSYVQDIMGDIFSLGFGPFRWVCASAEPEDLATTDRIAERVMEDIMKDELPEPVRQQYRDNLRWIREAGQHGLVVGSQARILYSDCRGRSAIALAFNEAVRDGTLQGPVIISRDHHDVSGTDSPYRETSNVYDGSAFTADMAVQNCIGDAFRGATWVSLHNGGGVGWGEVVNGGFGMVLDGSPEADERARNMLHWDVNNGIARRSWSGNDNADLAIGRAMEAEPLLRVTRAHRVREDTLLEEALKQ
ncbi:urocanate hydratase-like [Amphibalanus amphitrite]|uniref:urocanate hydratase-like n=1 Tax=Amphibalanus amphitrite TaxID=1232801 RepID=UPI001C92A72B|nr:urocanate hydratase-like [Amphibalanus amphitrite]XP_043222590.1 urocanate hydratase-like [Amphibalanus amphitrite]